MTFLSHNNNLCSVTLHYPSSTPPSSSTASSSSPSSTGWTTKITKKIQQLKSKLESLNNLKEAKNGYLTEQDSKSLDSLPTQLTSLETVSKLAEFADQLDTKNNNGNNILNNLCSGLETFLGFNPASKGYDGTGIVYSDLDRLCDGVMGFLSGVLGAVKNENEVTTYDKYISGDNKRLKSVLDLLQSSIGSGRNGLVDSVEQVKGWLEGYESQITGLTHNVISELTTLQENIPSKYIKEINDTQDLQSQLKTWTRATVEIGKHVNETLQHTINVLDSALKKQICIEILRIEKTVMLLLESARNKDFKGQPEFVDTQLKVQRRKVEHRLAQDFSKLREGVDALRDTQNNSILNINDGLKNAAQEMIDFFDLKYASYISSQFDIIKCHMDDINKSKNEPDTKNKCKLKEQVESIKQRVIEIQQEYKNKLKELCTDVKNKVGHDAKGTPGSGVLGRLTALDDAVKKGLLNIRRNIESEMISYVRGLIKAVQGEVTKIKNGVGDFTSSGVMKHWKDLNADIAKLADEIKLGKQEKRSSPNYGGIEGIRERMKEYVKTYSRETFAATVNKWLHKIMGNNEKVKMYVAAYLSGCESLRSQGNVKYNATQNDAAIIEAIRREIVNLIKSARITTPSGKESTVETMVVAINKFNEDIATAIEEGVENKKLVALTNQVEDYLGASPISLPQGTDPKEHLTSAIELTLLQLRIIVRTAADEIKAFTTESNVAGSGYYNIGTNLDNAILDAEHIKKKLNSSTEAGSRLTNALEQLKGHIKELDSQFHKALEEGTNAILGIDYKIDDNVAERVAKILNERIGAQHPGKPGHVGKPFNGDFMQEFKEATQIANGGGTLRNKIKEITQMFEKQFTDANEIVTSNMTGYDKAHKAYEQAMQDVIKKIDNLEDLPGTVDEAQKAAENLMSVQKTEIHNKLLDVCHAVDKASDLLDSAIQSLLRTLIAAQEGSSQVVKSAFQAVTCAFRSLFAESHRADLSALRSLVDQQLNAVQAIIAKDSVTGVKGLLDKVNKQFVKRLDDYVPKPQSRDGWNDKKLKDVAKKLIEVNGFLFYNLERQPDFAPLYGKVQPSYDSLINLLEHLEKSNEYDHVFTTLLERFNSALHDFAPKNFSTPCSPLLAPLKRGLSKFAEQLGHAYVNRYSGQKYTALTKPVEPSKTAATPKQPSPLDYDLTPEGRNCAKVCLTIVEILGHDLGELREICQGRLSKGIISLSSDLGNIFKRLGYSVADNSKSQDGELKRDDGMNGKHIGDTLLVGQRQNVYRQQGTGPLEMLSDYLHQYFAVCHYGTAFAKRQPCSVYEMLNWLSGLWYNPIHPELLGSIGAQLETPNNALAADPDGLVAFDMKDTYLNVHPKTVTYANFEELLDHICSTSLSVLKTIVGTGDEHTTYAVDCCNNSLGLHYPASGDACLQMLIDILRRMLPSLRFLFTKCELDPKHGGWQQCLYGKDISTTKIRCSEHLTDKPKCQPNCQANTKVKCQPTSPLMSYLNDCLPGHLPHRLETVGCGAKCATCPRSKPGMMCLTPLGFRQFSSSPRKGEEICEILRTLFSDFYLSSLFCFAPKRPVSLPEHFGFVLSLVDGWDSRKTSIGSLIKKSVETVITKQSIKLYADPTKFTTALCDAYSHTHNNVADKPHLTGYADLSSLAMERPCTVKGIHCAPYLSSLCRDAFIYSSEKNSNLYLSWLIYLPWQFWELLNSLYNEFCNVFCQDWGCRNCLRGDKCKKGKHGVIEDEKNPNPTCHCDSIVQCKGVSPTLYQYGFAFGEASILNHDKTPKKCSHFCSQLKYVLNSQYFKDLFKECDNFLWTIRTPFSYLVLALWSASFLYLLYVYIGRLDTLHIRSHLRIPASHKITAQSLLAAARVGKLAKISYLQP